MFALVWVDLIMLARVGQALLLFPLLPRRGALLGAMLGQRVALQEMETVQGRT